MAFLLEEDDYNHIDKRKEYGTEDRYSSEPQKVHLTGEFIIVAKYSGHALHHLASRLANVIDRLKLYNAVQRLVYLHKLSLLSFYL